MEVKEKLPSKWLIVKIHWGDLFRVCMRIYLLLFLCIDIFIFHHFISFHLICLIFLFHSTNSYLFHFFFFFFVLSWISRSELLSTVVPIVLRLFSLTEIAKNTFNQFLYSFNASIHMHIRIHRTTSLIHNNNNWFGAFGLDSLCIQNCARTPNKSNKSNSIRWRSEPTIHMQQIGNKTYRNIFEQLKKKKMVKRLLMVGSIWDHDSLCNRRVASVVLFILCRGTVD